MPERKSQSVSGESSNRQRAAGLVPSVTSLLLQQLPARFLQLATDPLRQCGQDLRQIDFDSQRIVLHIQPAGHFLPEGTRFKVQPIAVPSLLTGEHAHTAGELLLNLTEPLLDSLPGFVPTKFVRHT